MVRIRRRIPIVAAGLLLFVIVGPVLTGVSAGEPYRSPLEEPTYVTSSFAEYRGDHLHNGIDLSTGGQLGTPVVAIDTGTVVLQHRDGRRSWYSHLSRVPDRLLENSADQLLPGTDRTVTRTVRVDRGETIGWSGHTGRGPEHLHLVVEGTDENFLNPIGRFEPVLNYDPEPSLETLRIYSITANAWVEGDAGDVQLQESAEEPLKVWGTIGLDLTLWNRHRSGSNRSLPARVTVRRDGSVAQELDFSQLTPHEQDTGVVTYFDQLRSNLTPTSFTLHATPRDSNRWAGMWAGMEFTEKGKTGELSFEIATRRDETKTYRYNYEVVPPPERVEWESEHRSAEHSGAVESMRRASSNFRLASLKQGQFARRQYSPSSYETSREPSLDLETEWITNRVRVDLRIENRWEGWPRVRIEGDGFDTDLQLLQVEPGHFVGWWSPDWSRDGWYDFTASLPSEEASSEVRKEVYVQSLRRKKPGSVLSLDGRYSLFTSGSGLNANSFVSIRPTDRKPLRDQLSYVGAPGKVEPSWVESTERLEVTVDLTGFDEPDQIGLYQWEPVPGEWRAVSHQEGLTATSRTAQLSNPGTLALLRDDSPPEVGTPKYDDDRNNFLIPISEAGAGIDSITLTSARSTESIPTDWDPERNLLIVPGIRPVKAGDTFELSLVDRAGNRTTWTGEGLR